MGDTIKPVIGTNDDDTMYGGAGDEVFSGRGGDDTVYANNGHDLVYGGAGNDTLYGDSGNDVLWGSGGPNYIDLSTLTIAEDYEGQVIFEGESAGYRNTLGSYKVDESGTIYDVQFHFPNASLQGSGGNLIAGVSSSSLSLNAGDQVGFFIVSNGYSYNGGYSGLDLDNGTLAFRNQDGSAATISSGNPQLWLESTDGQETQILYHTYHSAAGVEGQDYALNPDGIAHTVGLLNTDEGKITLGFEDLYNGGDRDFDDAVFTVDIGQSNATVLDPNVTVSEGGVDSEAEYYWAYDSDGQLGMYDTDGNLLSIVEQNDDIYGGRGNDEIHGRAGHDLLKGGDGNDEIYGGSGNDIAYGGSGNDAIEAGSGNDEVYGESGHDELHGQSGQDYIDGGSGQDEIYGGKDEDILYGGSGNDTVDGGSDDDEIHGNEGNDKLLGQGGDDEIHGNSGNDRIEGGSGNDSLFGGEGQDNLDGGTGDDVIVGGSGNDVIEGRSGDDTIDAGDFHDVVRGGTGNDTINGGSGNDKLYGGSNDDFIISGEGRDVVDGGSGNDTVSYQGTSEGVNIDIHKKRVTGGDSDTLKSIENAIGSEFDDFIRGNRLDNELSGSDGDDVIRGMKGQDTLSGGQGNDTFVWRQSDLDSAIDSILDFSLTDDQLQFEVSAALVSTDLDLWMSFTTDGLNTLLSVDLDADGDGSDAIMFAQLNGLSINSLSDIDIAVV